MAKQPCPDKRLVYLHCSSIFSGANALLRKAKKISRLLEKHKGSLKILTKEFTLPAIAATAKELLDERIFEDLPRAKLRYPELWQPPSKTQEAERAASEAEVIRIEAEAANDVVLTSDDEGGGECLEFEQGQERFEPGGASKDNADAPDKAQNLAAEPWQVLSGRTIPQRDGHVANLLDSMQSTYQAHQAHSFLRLHPVYLPFKTQHRILVQVQTLLEECCLQFGNTWVPDLMEARKWHEAESIEITQWTQGFFRYADSLPRSAMRPIAGKSIAQVLSGISKIRHSAVHRLPTSAVGISNMLDAAVTFAEALDDSKRAERVGIIKVKLKASIEEIVQHQNLLERKLKDQLEDIARRRAELDELEKSSFEEMLAMDKKQRTEIGSTLESFLVSSEQVSNPCACGHVPSLDEPKTDSGAGENMETIWIQHEQKPPDEKDKAQTHDQSALGEEEPQYMDHAIGWEGPRKEDITAEPHNVAEEANSAEKAKPAKEAYIAASEEAFPSDESGINEEEEKPLLEDNVSPEPVSKEDPVEKENIAHDTVGEASQAELVNERFDDVEEHPLKQQDRLHEPTAEPDSIPMRSSPVEDESPTSPARAARNAEPEKPKFRPPPPSAPSSSVLEAAAPRAPPAEDKHTITLNILAGSTVFRSIVFINACTRTAILNEARAYCVQCAARDDHHSLGTLLANGCEMTLISLEMDGGDVDVSTYQVEDLSFLLRTIEKTGIPRFTLRICEV